MSQQQQTLIIKHNGIKTESFEFSDFECKYCNGRGGFDHSGYLAKFKKNFDDPDWKVCEICDGAKKLTAKVTIDWLPNEK